ncbi:MAG: nucleotidyl transferase AbiEii/AbiGii toxin family protein [Bryobacteraceae bacterium]
MIPQRNISLLSNRLAATGGRRIREDVLERDYCVGWFLAVLSQSDLKPVLGFKGGTALKRCYFSDYRFSEDLDFTLLEEIPFDEILRRLEAVYRGVRDGSGITFAFDRRDRQQHANSYTFDLRYTGPLPAGNGVKVDITVRERLVFPIEDRAVHRGYDEFTDIPENRLIRVYSLGEIVTEKVIALMDRARNEPRDLYDLWYLTSHEGVALDHLTDAIRRKLEFRGVDCEGIENAILRKEARLKALWSARLAYQMSHLPPFEEVIRAVRRTLRQANLP